MTFSFLCMYMCMCVYNVIHSARLFQNGIIIPYKKEKTGNLSAVCAQWTKYVQLHWLGVLWGSKKEKIADKFGQKRKHLQDRVQAYKNVTNIAAKSRYSQVTEEAWFTAHYAHYMSLLSFSKHNGMHLSWTVLSLNTCQKVLNNTGKCRQYSFSRAYYQTLLSYSSPHDDFKFVTPSSLSHTELWLCAHRLQHALTSHSDLQ